MFIKRLIFIFLGMIFLLNAAYAQKTATSDVGVESFVNDTKTDLLIVVAGGLAGAVLGLSTLSFVEEPKNHTRNILVGASLGIILGVGYVAFNQANRGRDMFYEGEEVYLRMQKAPLEFNTFARSQWHDNEISKRYEANLSLNQINYTFSY